MHMNLTKASHMTSTSRQGSQANANGWTSNVLSILPKVSVYNALKCTFPSWRTPDVCFSAVMFELELYELITVWLYQQTFQFLLPWTQPEAQDSPKPLLVFITFRVTLKIWLNMLEKWKNKINKKIIMGLYDFNLHNLISCNVLFM